MTRRQAEVDTEAALAAGELGRAEGAVASAALSHFSAELSLVREVLAAIDRDRATCATMDDVQSVLASLERRALGVSRVAHLMDDADGALARRAKRRGDGELN